MKTRKLIRSALFLAVYMVLVAILGIMLGASEDRTGMAIVFGVSFGIVSGIIVALVVGLMRRDIGTIQSTKVVHQHLHLHGVDPSVAMSEIEGAGMAVTVSK